MTVSLLLDLLSFSINNPHSFNLFFISFVVSESLVPSQPFPEPLSGSSSFFNYRAQMQYSRKCLSSAEQNGKLNSRLFGVLVHAACPGSRSHNVVFESDCLQIPHDQLTCWELGMVQTLSGCHSLAALLDVGTCLCAQVGLYCWADLDFPLLGPAS